MKGTCLGNYIASHFADRLLALKPADMPEQSHWQSDDTRVCDDACKEKMEQAYTDAIIHERSVKGLDLPRLAGDCWTCPTCGGPTRGSRDGKRIQDGRYFYGLHFVDPHYNPLDAKLERADGTFTEQTDVGKTLRELKKAGKIVDLEIVRDWYRATSKHATERHTRPSIDGACGFSSVEQIMKAIGLSLEYVNVRSKKLDIYTLIDARAQVAEVA
jgi:hypothetical protein